MGPEKEENPRNGDPPKAIERERDPRDEERRSSARRTLAKGSAMRAPG